MEPCTPLSVFVSQYLGAVRSRLRSHNQIARRLNRFIMFFGPSRSLGSIRRTHLADYVEARQSSGVSPASINIEIASFSAAWNYCVKRWELTLPNPVVGLYFRSTPGRLRYLEHDEATKLLQCAKLTRSRILPFFITLALHTGCRKGELLQLSWKSVDFERSVITIEAETTKTYKRRYLPMNRSARDALEHLLAYQRELNLDVEHVFVKRNGERWRYPERAFNRAIELAKINDFTVHDLRHTFASWLVSEGVELIKVRDLLGHSSIRMTERYAHLSPSRLHEAVAILDRAGLSLLTTHTLPDE